jgi:hypothetical protein
MCGFTYKLEARDHPMCWVRIEVMSYSFDFPLTQTASTQQPFVHGGDTIGLDNHQINLVEVRDLSRTVGNMELHRLPPSSTSFPNPLRDSATFLLAAKLISEI